MRTMTNASITSDPGERELCRLAADLRMRTIATSSRTGTPHLGSCLSCIDLLVFLYWRVLRIEPLRPRDPARDRFILSKGHGAPALFQVLAERGFYPRSALADFGADGSVFGEHPPTPDRLPGIEAATGSLGHGLPIALGMALAARIQSQSFRVFAILSDGECNEGSTWEAALMAAAQRVSNLTVFVDYNKWQATGRSDEVLALAPLADKWRAFGWTVEEIDGHDFGAMTSALERTAGSLKPRALIAHTIKGKGVSFMEDDNNWHYRIPTESEVRAAQQELAPRLDCVA
jgi:transketolase